VFWWGNFADGKQEPKRNNQCVQVTSWWRKMTAISVIRASKKNSPRCIKQTNRNTWMSLNPC
jgi:hypothetical protein